jgi:hypothetical protein
VVLQQVKHHGTLVETTSSGYELADLIGGFIADRAQIQGQKAQPHLFVLGITLTHQSTRVEWIQDLLGRTEAAEIASHAGSNRRCNIHFACAGPKNGALGGNRLFSQCCRRTEKGKNEKTLDSFQFHSDSSVSLARHFTFAANLRTIQVRSRD